MPSASERTSSVAASAAVRAAATRPSASAARRLERRVRLRTGRAGDRLGLGPGAGDDALGLGASLLLQGLEALVRLGELGGGLFLDDRQARLRLVRGLGRLPALLRDLLLGLRDLEAGGLELALEVIELLLALVEREPAQAHLLLGAGDPVLRGLLGVALDAIGELDRGPDELERLEPGRAAVGGEARAAVRRVRIRRKPLELRERDDVGDRLGLVPELAFFPRHGIHLAPARDSQAWISQPR